MNRFFRIAFWLFAIAVLGGSIFLWRTSRSLSGLEIKLFMPEETMAGVPFDLEVQIENNSESVLENAELAVEAPEGISFVGSSPDKRITIIPVGNLGIGSLTQETVRIVAIGSEQTVKEIEVKLAYVPERIGSRFEKRGKAAIAVLGSSAEVDIELPEQVFSGEMLTVKISYENLADQDLHDMRLVLEYPPAFSFVSADPAPSTGTNIWNIGDIKRGHSDAIIVKARLIGPDGAFFSLKARLETVLAGGRYTIKETTAPIAIAASPLSLAISANHENEAPAHIAEELEYVISFTNTTDIGMRDVIVSAKLSGDMFDLPTLNTNASLRAFDNTLIWNAGNTNGLGLIPPGGSGSVSFRVRVKGDFPIKRLSDKNFTLNVNAQIESPTVPPSVAADKTIALAEIETKIAGKITADALGLFRDADSGIVNDGPLPPRVGKPTEYTIHWKIKNYSTDVDHVIVRAFLGGNVALTGIVKSTLGSEPTYNANTQEVVWNVGAIPAGKGVLNSPAEATFQIEAIPSVNDLGKPMLLVRGTSVSAIDVFTGEELVANDVEITTTTLDDPTVSQGTGIVIP